MNIVAEVLCVDCGMPISTARLEILPDTRQCSTCCKPAEKKQGRRIDDPCPRCGRPLEWRCRTEGNANYFIGCTAYPICRFTE